MSVNGCDRHLAKPSHRPTAGFEYIGGWYTLHRLHSSLDYPGLATYEAALTAWPPHR